MKRVGLTGNMGAGKSTVAKVFNVMGVPVYHADQQAKTFLQTEAVAQQIRNLFGEKVVNQDLIVDRKALAQIVFNDKAQLDALNHIIHPLVKQDFEEWCLEHERYRYIIHEAAVLFESGFDRLFDSTILVMAPEELCISRVMQRDGMSKDMVIARLLNQWSQEEKQELATYLILNNDLVSVIPQIISIHDKILAS